LFGRDITDILFAMPKINIIAIPKGICRHKRIIVKTNQAGNDLSRTSLTKLLMN